MLKRVGEGQVEGASDATALGHLGAMRRKLLDLSTTNRLIHFPHSERARNYVRVVDEVPEQLHERLLAGRALTIAALDEPSAQDTRAESLAPPAGTGTKEARRPPPEAVARSLGIDPSFELPPPAISAPKKHSDDAVQTLLYPDLHQKVLAKIADLTRTASEEQGIQSLFVAFGFLEWYERKDSAVPRFAPLVLFPVEVDRARRTSGYTYSIAAHDDAPEVNIALAEKLKREFAFRLPAWLEDDSLADYLSQVGAALVHQPTWKLHRWVTIANFSSARIAMYHDLDVEGWPAGESPHVHPTFQALTCDRSEQHETAYENDDEAAAERADELESLVLDGDSSQVAAILEAMEDRNLVIKGPPGTGKSQTIANLISTALHKKLRVLFVAEKMAALEVVKDRLDRAGLGEFCLELHSLKGTRRGVLESLGRRIAMNPEAPAKIEHQRHRTRALRESLNEYIAALHSQPGALQVTVHDLIWRRERLRNELGADAVLVESVGVRHVLQLTAHELDRTRHLLASIVETDAARRGESWSGEAPVWREITSSSVSEEEAVSRMQAWRDASASAVDLVRAALGEQLVDTLSLDQLSALARLAARMPDDVLLRHDLLGKLREPQTRDALRSHVMLGLHKLSLSELLEARSAEGLQASALGPLQAALQLLGGESTTVPLAHIVQGAAAALDSLNATSGEIHRASELLAFAGVHLDVDSGSLLALRDALETLERVQPTVLRIVRTVPAALDITQVEGLRQLAAECAELRARGASLDERLVLAEANDEVRRDGRELALALQRPIWFAWLFRGFWIARRLHARLRRGPARSAQEAARDLAETAEHLARIETFERRVEVRALAGAAWKGAATDFELLAESCLWVEQTRRTFARMHPAARTFRELLLAGDLERLHILRGEAGKSPLSSAWELASAGAADARAMDVIIAERAGRLRATQEAAQGLIDLGVPGQATVEEVRALAGILHEMETVSHRQEQLRSSVDELDVWNARTRTELHSITETVEAVEFAAQEGLPIAAVATLSTPQVRSRLVQSAGPITARLHAARAHLEEVGIEARVVRWSAESIASLPTAANSALEGRRALRSHLQYLVQVARGRESCARDVLDLVLAGRLASPKLVSATEFATYDGLIREATRAHSSLRTQSGSELEAIRAQFRELDREILALNAKAIVSDLLKVSVPNGVASGRKAEWTELALIQHEMSKKVRHLSLRQLLQRAGGAVRALKPCVMMSPLTAAQFLPRIRDQFDLVVIDEASQMRPEDAVGALVRARRAVVVGDPKQLPPTSFFRTIQSSSDADEDEDAQDEELEAESVLDLGQASFGAPRDLQWHYRSRHPSLIAFSNEHFYDGRLKVFPAPHGSRGDLGVHLIATDGEYTSSVNAVEARRIAEAVIAHAHEFPNRSIGVVAMNIKQRELILDVLRERKDEAYARLEEAGANGQKFFVKSLENVQGDERDVIFVSMTYGPAPGTQRVLQRFGPINGVYGARRLNVLFTRARERLVVFSSLRSEDIIADESSSSGLHALKNYLVYAERGELAHVSRNKGSTESAFEDSVRDVLASAGFETDAQVGVQGFFIDLGVKRLNEPGYFCGVECDGASYHSHRSARDRDRLRQDVLEAQGWRIVRVWSTDWFRNPVAAREKLLAQVREYARP
jgi:very-short-patch-repair endonuclease